MYAQKGSRGEKKVASYELFRTKEKKRVHGKSKYKFDSNAVRLVQPLSEIDDTEKCTRFVCVHLLGNVLILIFFIWQEAQSQIVMIFKEKDYCIVIETQFDFKCRDATQKKE